MSRIVTEESVLKALNELEEAVAKGGDPLAGKSNHEGGFSSEGTPLSPKAKEGSVVKGGDEDSGTGKTASDPELDAQMIGQDETKISWI